MARLALGETAPRNTRCQGIIHLCGCVWVKGGVGVYMHAQRLSPLLQHLPVVHMAPACLVAGLLASKHATPHRLHTTTLRAGEKVCEHAFDVLLDAAWLPPPPGTVFEDRPPSPERLAAASAAGRGPAAGGGATSAAAASKPAYRYATQPVPYTHPTRPKIHRGNNLVAAYHLKKKQITLIAQTARPNTT